MLAIGDDIAAANVAAGAVPPLVDLLRTGSDKSKAAAVRALRMLAMSITCSNDIGAMVLPLVELMRNGSDMGRESDAEVLDILGVEILEESEDELEDSEGSKKDEGL
jgi:hypothetical protein